MPPPGRWHPLGRKGLPQAQPLLAAFRALFWQVAPADAWIGSLWSLELAPVPWLGGWATEGGDRGRKSCAHTEYRQPMTLGLSTKGHLNPCCHSGCLDSSWDVPPHHSQAGEMGDITGSGEWLCSCLHPLSAQHLPTKSSRFWRGKGGGRARFSSLFLNWRSHSISSQAGLPGGCAQAVPHQGLCRAGARDLQGSKLDVGILAGLEALPFSAWSLPAMLRAAGVLGGLWRAVPTPAWGLC